MAMGLFIDTIASVRARAGTGAGPYRWHLCNKAFSKSGNYRSLRSLSRLIGKLPKKKRLMLVSKGAYFYALKRPALGPEDGIQTSPRLTKLEFEMT